MACLAGIVSFYTHWFHANTTTVALTFLLVVLFVAARWGLRQAIVTSLVAAACYNYYFLPPIHTFTVADPQNLLALVVFVGTSIFASRLAQRIRAESQEARRRQSDLEALYSLSRSLLQTDELAKLTNSVPNAIAAAVGATEVLFYLLDGDRVYRTGLPGPGQPSIEELKELSHASMSTQDSDGESVMVPLRSGVRPCGVIVLRGSTLSEQTLEAVAGLVSAAVDRARAVEQLSMAEAEKESERLRGLMLDSIAHDLRTPLTSIKASVGTLLLTDLTEESSHELLVVIDEESDRLNTLVAQAMEMVQLDAQSVSMHLGAHPLQEMVSRSLAANASTLAGHEVVVRLPDLLPDVIADPAWIEKLLGNLLQNAAKYSGADQPIFISAEVSGGSVACSVADRGVGIDPSEQGLIFNKFYRSPKRGPRTSGTGMGLAICRAIIAAHNGSLTVTSQVGQGSVFTFELPQASA